MTEVSLKLEILKLSSPKERIRLLVTPSARFQCQDGDLQRLPSTQLLDLLETGKVCAIRGSGCYMDFRIVLKQLQPSQITDKALTEDLGHFVHEAPVSSAHVVLLFISFTESYYSGGHNFQSPLLSNFLFQILRT